MKVCLLQCYHAGYLSSNTSYLYLDIVFVLVDSLLLNGVEPLKRAVHTFWSLEWRRYQLQISAQGMSNLDELFVVSLFQNIFLEKYF